MIQSKVEKVEKYYYQKYLPAQRKGGFSKFFQKLLHPKLYFAAEVMGQSLQKKWIVLNQLPIALQIYENGKLAYANEECLRLLGLKSASKIAEFSEKFLQEDSSSYEKLVDFEDAKVKGFSTCREGKAKFLVQKKPIKCSNGGYYAVFIVEITQIHEKVVQLAAIAEKFKAEAASSELVVGVLGHDLKNLMNAVIGMSEMMAEEIDEMKEETIRLFSSSIHKQMKEMNAILSDMISWYKAKSENYQRERRLLREIVDEGIAIYANGEKRIKFENAVPKDVVVDADPAVLSCILRNLLSNSVKFSNYEGKIRIEAEKLDGKVKMKIIDNGVGITKETLALLFGNGNVESAKGTSGEKGVGVGLLLVKEIVASSGGTISAESEVLKGTTVTVILPAHKEK
ncbi:MAG: HAMP domain-containing sensor histidine kinase [Candidatus Anstonellaceae archaeon]